jgi:hypothetical protein
LQQLYLGGLCLVRRSYCLVTFDSSELVLIKILYFGSNLLNVGLISQCTISGFDRQPFTSMHSIETWKSSPSLAPIGSTASQRLWLCDFLDLVEGFDLCWVRRVVWGQGDRSALVPGKRSEYPGLSQALGILRDDDGLGRAMS